jgi:hypothetical protein
MVRRRRAGGAKRYARKHYKFNSTPRNKYAGYRAISLKKSM